MIGGSPYYLVQQVWPPAEERHALSVATAAPEAPALSPGPKLMATAAPASTTPAPADLPAATGVQSEPGAASPATPPALSGWLLGAAVIMALALAVWLARIRRRRSLEAA
jgi:hypothetical protein